MIPCSVIQVEYMNPDNKIPLKELISYFGYGMGQCFSFGLVGSFILYFYTDVMGISPVTASMIFDSQSMGCSSRSPYRWRDGYPESQGWKISPIFAVYAVSYFFGYSGFILEHRYQYCT